MWKSFVCYPTIITIECYGNKRFNEGLNEKYAFSIEHLYKLKIPIYLNYMKVKYKFTAPQSFMYTVSNKPLYNYVTKQYLVKVF